MKNYLIIILVCIGFKSYAQERITVSTNAAGTFIETYKKSYSNELTLKDLLRSGPTSTETLKEGNKKSYSNELTLDHAYRLGPTSTKTLKEGLRTAIKWIDLNVTHQKDFEKEVCRFRAMEKETYKFHGYVDQFAVEMTLYFKGNSDGTFVLEIKQNDSPLTFNTFSDKFITFSDKKMIISFLDLLDGKSANKEIDDIFKK